MNTTDLISDPANYGYLIVGIGIGIMALAVVYLVVDTFIRQLKPKEPPEESEEHEEKETESAMKNEVTDMEPQQYSFPNQQTATPNALNPTPNVAGGVRPEARADAGIPELTPAQKREKAGQVWSMIAADTFFVFNAFIQAGFTRAEALELTQAYLTGKIQLK